MQIFLNFWTHALVSFLQSPQILNKFLYSPLHIPTRYEDIWNFSEVELFLV